MAARRLPPDAFLETCPRCGKRTYSSKAQAKRAARVLYPGARMRLYRCGEGWHITSQSARNAACRRAQAARNAETGPARTSVKDCAGGACSYACCELSA